MLAPEQDGLEKLLGSLVPQAPELHRDQILFRAGQLSPAKGSRLWPLTALALVLLAAASNLFWYVQPEPRPLVRFVVIHEPSPKPPEDPIPEFVQAPAAAEELPAYSYWTYRLQHQGEP